MNPVARLRGDLVANARAMRKALRRRDPADLRLYGSIVSDYAQRLADELDHERAPEAAP
jgi:hypothetical protein